MAAASPFLSYPLWVLSRGCSGCKEPWTSTPYASPCPGESCVIHTLLMVPLVICAQSVQTTTRSPLLPCCQLSPFSSNLLISGNAAATWTLFWVFDYTSPLWPHTSNISTSVQHFRTYGRPQRNVQSCQNYGQRATQRPSQLLTDSQTPGSVSGNIQPNVLPFSNFMIRWLHS